MIPRIIIQLWIGPKRMPTEWMNTWKEKNPSFEYRLWTEKEIDEFGLRNRAKYDRYIGRQSYHGATDIARVEILERFGGIYIDADSICLETLEGASFLEGDFFAAIEYDRRLANGAIGATPGHPIMKEYLQRITEAVVLDPPCFTIGGTMLTSCVDAHGKDDKVTILPTYSFYPHVRHVRVPAIGKCYSRQLWATTKGLYQ